MKAKFYKNDEYIPLPAYFLRPKAEEVLPRHDPIGIPSGWEWMAAHDWNPDEGPESVGCWDRYLVNSELLNDNGGDWRICDD